jgi:hypothetical protein
MTPESKVKDFIDKRMKLWFPDAVKYSPPGGRWGKSGFPDRMYFIKATDKSCVVVAIEAKADGKEATQLQLHTLVKLKEQGVLSAIVIGKDEEYMVMVRDEIVRRIRVANGQ